MDIKAIRAQYPQYQDLSDDDLGRALHKKFYADMPYDTFASKVGIRPQEPIKVGAEGLPKAIAETAKEFSAPSKFAIGAAGGLNDMAMRLKQLAVGSYNAVRAPTMSELVTGKAPALTPKDVAGEVQEAVRRRLGAEATTTKEQ